jgi:hypothetical protein
VYVLTFDEDIRYSEEELLGLLNSSVAEFVIKQTSPPLRGKPFRYRYKSQYVNKIPLPAGSGNIGEKVKEILEIENIKQKVNDFPESFLKQYKRELSHIDYTWQTKRSSVDPTINEEDGVISIDAGRTDSIRNALINTETKAKYIREVVEDMSVDSGESISIPIPVSDIEVQDVMSELNNDKATFDPEKIFQLENKIDEAVYSLLEIDQKEKQTVQDCLDLF